jgi:signal peptidase II
MNELEKQMNDARPDEGRAFFSCACKAAWPGLGSQLIFWSLAVIGFLLDLWSKSVVFNWLKHRQTNSFSVIDGFFQMVIAENTGAAFGVAAGQRMLLITVSFVALAVILVIFLFSRDEPKLVQVALGLFAAGVAGNLYDRLFNDGRVRDFIDIVYWPGRHWPAFNLADSVLCLAVALVIISVFFTGRQCQKRAQQRE